MTVESICRISLDSRSYVWRHKVAKNASTVAPSKDRALFMAEMGRYNEELIKAGVLLALGGLHPSSKGARVKFFGKSRTVGGGPFTEARSSSPASRTCRSSPSKRLLRIPVVVR